MSLRNRLVHPLLAFNVRRKTLMILNRTEPFELLFECESGKSIQPRALYLDFVPTSLLALDDFLIIQGLDCVAGYCIDTGNLHPLGKHGRKICNICAHPLSNRAVGILTSDSNLSIYTLPNENSDFTINLSRLAPAKFTFFSENPKNLFAFGACVLTMSGQLFTISPILPQSFKLKRDVLAFKQILKIQGNSYLAFEKKLPEWLNQLEYNIAPESKNRESLNIANLSFEKPVPRGPCYSTSDSCLGLKVISDSNPSVIVLNCKNKLKILIGTGDLVPSFGETRPSIEWELLEEINLPRGELLHAGKYLVCMCDGDIIKIELPWLTIVKESYTLRKPVKTLPKSVISVIRSNCMVQSCLVFNQKFTEVCCLATETELFYENLNSSNVQGDYISVERSDLLSSIQIPSIPVHKFEPISQVSLNIGDYSGEENEIAELFEVFNRLLMHQGVPLCNRLEAVMRILQDFNSRYDRLNKNYEELNKKVQYVDSYHQEFMQKIEAIEANDQRMRDRIKDIIEIQQNTKKPLTQIEKELSLKLSALEGDSNVLKIEFQKSLGELGAAQSKLRSITEVFQPDPQISEDLDSLSYQLGEISSEISKFKQSVMLKNP